MIYITILAIADRISKVSFYSCIRSLAVGLISQVSTSH